MFLTCFDFTTEFNRKSYKTNVITVLQETILKTFAFRLNHWLDLFLFTLLRGIGRRVFHLPSLSPTILALYLFISFASCASLPFWYKVLTFQHPSLVLDLNCSRLFLLWTSRGVRSKAIIRTLLVGWLVWFLLVSVIVFTAGGWLAQSVVELVC